MCRNIFILFVYVSNKLNISQNSNTIKVFLIKPQKKRKPDEILIQSQLCVTKLFTLFQFSPPKC